MEVNMKKKLVMVFLTFLTLIIPFNSLWAEELDDIRTLLEKKQLDTALIRVNNYLGINPNKPEALFLKGLILFESEKIDQSIEIFKLLTQEYPSKPELFNNLAVAYAIKGEYDNAKEALQRAIKVYPGYTKAHENLGDIYMNIARNAYEKALQLDPEKKSLQSKLNHINNLPIMQPGKSKPYSQKTSEEISDTVVRRAESIGTEPVAINTGPVAKVEAEKMAEAAIQEEIKKMANTPDVFTQAKPQESPPSQPPPMVQTGPCSDWIEEPELKAANENNILRSLQNWADKWSAMDIEGYLACYAPDFQPQKGWTKSYWEKHRRSRFNKKYIVVSVSEPVIDFVTCSLARVTFDQDYESGTYRDHTKKLIIFKNTGADWRIIKESSIN